MAAVIRRLRFRMILIAVPVVLLLAAVAIGWWFVQSGRIEQRAAAVWRERGHEGNRAIGSIRFAGVALAVVEGVRITSPAGVELGRADRVEVTLDWTTRSASLVKITGAHATLLDPVQYAFLRKVIKVEADRKSSKAPTPLRLDISGTATLAGGLQLEGLHVEGTTLGSDVKLTATGTVAGRPLALDIASGRNLATGPIRLRIAVVTGSVEVAPTIASIDTIGILKAPPRGLMPWLPKEVTADGTTLVIDPEADAWSGSLVAAWDGGGGTAKLETDRRRLRLERLQVKDARLGSATGRLIAQLDGDRILQVECPVWQPGPGLPIPAQVPIAAAMEALPAMMLRTPDEGGILLRLSGAGSTRLDLRFIEDRLRIDGADLPLALAQNWLPGDLRIAGGSATSFRLSLAGGEVRDIAAELRQARLAWNGWTLGPLDGPVSVLPLAATATTGAGATVSLALPKGRTTITARGSSVLVELATTTIEGVLSRLHGPASFPPLTGEVLAKAQFTLDPAGLAFSVRQLDLKGVVVGDPFARGERLRRIEAGLSGDGTWKDGELVVAMKGQLRSGEVRLLGGWQDLASRTPVLQLRVRVATAAGIAVAVEEILARAADASGRPVDGGWSFSAQGRLSGTPLSGRIEGVMDRVDLAWLTARIPGFPVTVQGLSAAAFRVDLGQGVVAIEGTLLPLGADLKVGPVQIDGLQGAVRFGWREEPLAEDAQP